MNYLAAEEYENYGIEASTPASWVAAASSMIDAHCRRATLGASQYTERLRLTPGRNSVQLTYLPLTTLQGQNSPIVSARGRYATPRRGDDLTTWDMAQEVAAAFALPGTWVDLDVSQMDCIAPRRAKCRGWAIRWGCNSRRSKSPIRPGWARFPTR